MSEPNPADALKARLRARFEAEGQTWGAGRPVKPEKPKTDKPPRANHTQRTYAHLKAQGYTVTKADSWNSFANRTNDMFGIFDLLALGNGETVGVQLTSKANMSARRKKILDSKFLPKIREAGWKVLLIGWHKPGHKWEAVEEWL